MQLVMPIWKKIIYYPKQINLCQYGLISINCVSIHKIIDNAGNMQKYVFSYCL